MIDGNYGNLNLEKDHGLRLEEYDSEISNVKNNSKCPCSLNCKYPVLLFMGSNTFCFFTGIFFYYLMDR